METQSQFKPGDEVGAERWPYMNAPPGAWGRPWKGVVLSWEDDLAWQNIVERFNGNKDLVAQLRAERQNNPFKCVPVLWDFGNYGHKTIWEERKYLRYYTDDYAAWIAARSEATRKEEERMAAYKARMQAAEEARVNASVRAA